MSNRRGMTLVLVLVMSALIGMSAMLLFSTTNMEMMIAGNTRRINQAKIAATSGISHFVALELKYNQLKNMAGQQDNFTIIPRTSLGRKTYYEVKVMFLNASEKIYLVESVGTYQKGNKILSSYPIRASFTAK
jgi:Tfp pilus assembly protein PilX